MFFRVTAAVKDPTGLEVFLVKAAMHQVRRAFCEAALRVLCPLAAMMFGCLLFLVHCVHERVRLAGFSSCAVCPPNQALDPRCSMTMTLNASSPFIIYVCHGAIMQGATPLYVCSLHSGPTRYGDGSAREQCRRFGATCDYSCVFPARVEFPFHDSIALIHPSAIFSFSTSVHSLFAHDAYFPWTHHLASRPCIQPM